MLPKCWVCLIFYSFSTFLGCILNTDKNHEKILRKVQKIVPNFILSKWAYYSPISTKIFSLWENWGKHSVYFSKFSYDFCPCKHNRQNNVFLFLFGQTVYNFLLIFPKIGLGIKISVFLQNRIDKKSLFWADDMCCYHGLHSYYDIAVLFHGSTMDVGLMARL